VIAHSSTEAEVVTACNMNKMISLFEDDNDALMMDNAQ
jgi:hypothetical protein